MFRYWYDKTVARNRIQRSQELEIGSEDDASDN